MRKILISLGLMLLLCGCVKVDIGLNLNGDGSGTFEEQVVVKSSGLASAGLTAKVIDDSIVDLNVGNGITLEDTTVTIDGEEYIGKKLSFSFSSYSDLQKKLTTVFSAASDTDENTNDDVNKIANYVTIENGIVYLDMPAETFISGVTGDSKFGYDIDATFYIEMNDIEVESSNADRVDGTRYEWDLMDRNSNIQIAFKQQMNIHTGIIIVVIGIILMLSLVYIDCKKILEKKPKTEDFKSALTKGVAPTEENTTEETTVEEDTVEEDTVEEPTTEETVVEDDTKGQ